MGGLGRAHTTPKLLQNCKRHMQCAPKLTLHTLAPLQTSISCTINFCLVIGNHGHLRINKLFLFFMWDDWAPFNGHLKKISEDIFPQKSGFVSSLIWCTISSGSSSEFLVDMTSFQLLMYIYPSMTCRTKNHYKWPE